MLCMQVGDPRPKADLIDFEHLYVNTPLWERPDQPDKLQDTAVRYFMQVWCVRVLLYADI